MTVRFASVVIIFSSIFTIFLLKFVYIVGLAPLRCEVWLVHTKIILLILSILFVLCTALNFIVYRQTRTLLSKSRTISPLDDGHQMEWTELTSHVVNKSSNEAGSSPYSSFHRDCNSTYSRLTSSNIHVNKKIIDQMEMEATLTLVIGVTSLVVTACPPIIFVSSFLTCRLISQSDCSHFNWLAPYMIELMGLVHIVCSPLIFLIRNKEFRMALMSQLKQLISKK